MALSPRGQALFDAWTAARDAATAAQDAANAAAATERDARNRLGRWLAPDDMKPLERVAVIAGKTQIDAYLSSDGEFLLGVRVREKADNT